MTEDVMTRGESCRSGWPQTDGRTDGPTNGQTHACTHARIQLLSVFNATQLSPGLPVPVTHVIYFEYGNSKQHCTTARVSRWWERWWSKTEWSSLFTCTPAPGNEPLMSPDIKMSASCCQTSNASSFRSAIVSKLNIRSFKRHQVCIWLACISWGDFPLFCWNWLTGIWRAGF